MPVAKGAGVGTSGARSGRGDERFGFLFLNPDGLRRWPAEAAAPAVVAPAAAVGSAAAARREVVPLAPEVQLLVPKTQLYRLTASKLRLLGWLPAGGVREDQIRLYQRRYNAADPAHYLASEVPIRLLGDGGDFSDGEALLFYALRSRDDNAWTDDSGGAPVDLPGCGDPYELNNGPSGAADPGLRTGNVYWLAFADAPAGAPWARMSEATLPPSAGAPLPRYRRVDYLEEDSGYREFTLNADSDRNHYNRYTDTAATVSIPLWSPDPAGTDGQARAGLMGWSISDFDRLVRASLVCGANTVDLGTHNLNTLTEVIAYSADAHRWGSARQPERHAAHRFAQRSAHRPHVVPGLGGDFLRRALPRRRRCAGVPGRRGRRRPGFRGDRLQPRRPRRDRHHRSPPAGLDRARRRQCRQRRRLLHALAAGVAAGRFAPAVRRAGGPGGQRRAGVHHLQFAADRQSGRSDRGERLARRAGDHARRVSRRPAAVARLPAAAPPAAAMPCRWSTCRMSTTGSAAA